MRMQSSIPRYTFLLTFSLPVRTEKTYRQDVEGRPVWSVRGSESRFLVELIFETVTRCIWLRSQGVVLCC